MSGLRVYHASDRPLVVPIGLVLDEALTDADVRLWLRAALCAEKGRDVPPIELDGEDTERLIARGFLAREGDVWDVLNGEGVAW